MSPNTCPQGGIHRGGSWAWVSLTAPTPVTQHMAVIKNRLIYLARQEPEALFLEELIRYRGNPRYTNRQSDGPSRLLT